MAHFFIIKLGAFWASMLSPGGERMAFLVEKYTFLIYAWHRGKHVLYYDYNEGIDVMDNENKIKGDVKHGRNELLQFNRFNCYHNENS